MKKQKWMDGWAMGMDKRENSTPLAVECWIGRTEAELE
jgi:hypothetical protein